MDSRVDRPRKPRPPGVPAPAARRKAGPSIKAPPRVALEYAEDVARRVSERPVPVRNGFIERLDPAATVDAPLAVLLRGGQGGAVRVKLLLAMLWFSVRAPHETSYPARGWAGLLGLDEYETNGARRITAAIEWLEANDLVRVVRSPGLPSEVFLLDERATGDPYVLPFVALKAKRDAGEPEGRDDYYVTLRAEFFTRGWIAVLSAPAVAMLLVMALEAKYKKSMKGLWQSPKMASSRFGLSQDTRTAGLRELEMYGIVDRRTGPVSPGVFDMKRRRNVYDLHLEQLVVGPGQPRPDQELGVDELSVEVDETRENSVEQSQPDPAERPVPPKKLARARKPHRTKTATTGSPTPKRATKKRAS